MNAHNSFQISKFHYFRGSLVSGNIIDHKYVRANRKPLNSSPDVSLIYDQLFEPLAGFKPRSNALFTSTSEHLAACYGDLHLIFPIGNFNYLYLKGVSDLYNDIDRLVPGGESADIETLKGILAPLAHTNNLRTAQSYADVIEGLEVNINNTDGYHSVNIQRACQTFNVDMDELIRTIFSETNI